jgi:hypothetical protein
MIEETKDLGWLSEVFLGLECMLFTIMVTSYQFGWVLIPAGRCSSL